MFTKLLVVFAFLAAFCAQAQENNGRTFFPKDSVRGFTEFSIAPPHNEVDVNRCSVSTTTGDVCTAFARYMLSGYLEVQPFGRGHLRRVFAFWEPKMFLGNNVPQVRYTYTPTPMLFEQTMGVGVELPKGFELRLTQHTNRWLGKYNGNLGRADLGPNGPYGLYTTVGVRYYFGARPQHR